MARRRANGEGTIYKRRDGLWCASLMVGRNPKTGRAIRKVVYGRTQKEAKSKLDAVKREIYSGVNYARKPPTVAAWLRSWMKIYKSDVKPKTREYYQNAIDSYIVPYMGATLITNVRPVDVQLMVNELAETLSTSTVRGALVTLRAALDKAVHEGYILRNPAGEVKAPAKEARKMRAMSRDDQDAFLGALEGRWYKNLYRVALYTGMRRGELLGLQWGDVGAESITVARAIKALNKGPEVGDPKTKSGKRTIPLCTEAIAALQDERARRIKKGMPVEKSSSVFESESGTIPGGQNLNRSLAEICEAAGIPRYTMHELRHTYATRCAEAGIPLPYVMYLMGDADAATVRNTYQHMADSSLLREYVQKIFGQNCHSNCHSDGENDDV
jgi:integrase